MEVVPAWPPMASRSRSAVRRPSDAPYTLAARPEGPAPITFRLGCSSQGRGKLRHVGIYERPPVEDQEDRKSLRGDFSSFEQVASRFGFDLVKAVGDRVPAQEITN